MRTYEVHKPNQKKDPSSLQADRGHPEGLEDVGNPSVSFEELMEESLFVDRCPSEEHLPSLRHLEPQSEENEVVIELLNQAISVAHPFGLFWHLPSRMS